MEQLTALITGASEGLGKSFAIESAKRGLNLVLVSLPNSGLEYLANYLRVNFNTQVFCIEIDLTESTSASEIFERLQVQQIDVNVLINNAGIGNWSWFEDKNNEFYKTQIDLNITNTVLLTRLFLKHIDKKLPNYILNVGSLGGHFIVPKKQVYGATKSFIGYFTRCLRLELSGTNVRVSLLSPGGINTKPELLVMNNNLEGFAKATILEADFVAKAAMDGMLKGKKEIIPGFANRLLVLLDKILPAFLKEIIIRRKLSEILKA
ncbi:SDR family NAD(P)-dependent oxidoreductase [Pedobacter frigiditerrae]|uniref:SDR family NAD(P)-dependent oxidoreductase n=1 Tax=Pedobacter frigiditerrae TaxID=2530452 RepID=UPI002931E885|nr:SDR family NAD(P)-dependent oxidoreductase [Pedobacter frigiditerrae]